MSKFTTEKAKLVCNMDKGDALTVERDADGDILLTALSDTDDQVVSVYASPEDAAKLANYILTLAGE